MENNPQLNIISFDIGTKNLCFSRSHLSLSLPSRNARFTVDNIHLINIFSCQICGQDLLTSRLPDPIFNLPTPCKVFCPKCSQSSNISIISEPDNPKITKPKKKTKSPKEDYKDYLIFHLQNMFKSDIEASKYQTRPTIIIIENQLGRQNIQAKICQEIIYCFFSQFNFSIELVSPTRRENYIKETLSITGKRTYAQRKKDSQAMISYMIQSGLLLPPQYHAFKKRDDLADSIVQSFMWISDNFK